MLNIKTRAVAETLTFQLHDADDEPLAHEGKPCMVTVYGPGSKKFLQAQQAKSDKLMAKVSKGKGVKFTADEMQRNQAEFLALVTESIDVDYDGLQGYDKHLAIYSDTTIGFIADQINAKLGDWGNFKRP